MDFIEEVNTHKQLLSPSKLDEKSHHPTISLRLSLPTLNNLSPHNCEKGQDLHFNGVLLAVLHPLPTPAN